MPGVWATAGARGAYAEVVGGCGLAGRELRVPGRRRLVRRVRREPQLPDHPHRLQYDPARHLRLDDPPIDELNWHLDDAEAQAGATVIPPDLERVAVRVDRVEIEPT